MLFGISVSALSANDTAELPYYIVFSGKVISISDVIDVNGEKTGSSYVLIEGEDGLMANFIVSEKTYMLTDNEPQIGDRITGIGEMPMQMIMIYPAQYMASAIAVNMDEKMSIYADLFDENLMGKDGKFKIITDESTKIIDRDGTEFTGEIKNAKLVVVCKRFDEETLKESVAEKIIVMNKFQRGEEFDISKAQLIVSDKVIEGAPAAYYNDDGYVMVPLRVIAESLGYNVTWDNGAIDIGSVSSMKIRSYEYTYSQMGDITLKAAPELSEDGKTFVPLSYFRDVLKLNNAYVFEGQIVIDNAEIMN